MRTNQTKTPAASRRSASTSARPPSTSEVMSSSSMCERPSRGRKRLRSRDRARRLSNARSSNADRSRGTGEGGYVGGRLDAFDVAHEPSTDAFIVDESRHGSEKSIPACWFLHDERRGIALL
jgi:hypothetical protein